MALAAVMIPVFLVLTALVVESGNWFTHDRQLQNRADAAAFAAGIEYARHWRECVQTSDPAQQLIAAQKIANAARQFAADPEAADYTDLDPSGTVPASLYNDQIASQDPVQANNKLDVVINSRDNDYGDDRDYTDDYDADDTAADPVKGTPCYPHATDPENLSDTDPPVQWTDVKVTERSTAGIFFWESLAPDLHARARVEIRPAASGNGFLPLAVPNNNIAQVQIRYYNECNGNLIPNSTYDLKPLPGADQAQWLALGKGVLWGLPNPSRPAEGDRSQFFNLAVPSYDPSCGDYLPVGVEVRLASRDYPEVDINASCATLAASKFADCFRRLSQIRVWNDGNPENQPRLRDVRLIGGCPNTDAYFGTLPIGATNCQFEVEADVDWGTRDDDNRNVDNNFTVEANGVNMTLVSSPSGDQSGIYRTDGPINASPGANPVTISLEWDDNNPSHEWPAGTRCGGPRCEYSANESAHRAWVGTRGNAGAVELVRSSSSNFVTVPPAGPLPGPPRDNVNDGGVSIPIYPTVATRALLRTGTLVTLRLDDPQENQTLQCDPAVTSGRVFESFRYGCQPYYDDNKFVNGPWWNTATKLCPPTSAFFSYSTMPAPYGKNGNGNPWRCVPTAPGLRPPTIGEGMSAATGNCTRFVSNQCQQTNCLVQGNYDGIPGNPVGWTKNSDSNDPRVVNLFVIPYQSLKGSTGSDPEETVPIYGFASFYVMNWTGQAASNSDPCPDRTFGTTNVPDPPPGSATGVFVEAIDYETGPVDPEAVCFEGMLERCRAVLVR